MRLFPVWSYRIFFGFEFFSSGISKTVPCNQKWLFSFFYFHHKLRGKETCLFLWSFFLTLKICFFRSLEDKCRKRYLFRNLSVTKYDELTNHQLSSLASKTYNFSPGLKTFLSSCDNDLTMLTVRKYLVYHEAWIRKVHNMDHVLLLLAFWLISKVFLIVIFRNLSNLRSWDLQRTISSLFRRLLQ